MTTPTIAIFPEEELRKRLGKVRTLCKERGFDSLVVFDTDSITAGGTVRWLTNFSNVIAPGIASILVDSFSDDPILLINPGFADCQITQAELHCPIGKVEPLRSANKSRGWDQSIVKALRQLGFKGNTLGIDGMGFLPYDTVEGLKQSLPGVTLRDASGIVHTSALVRSDLEEPFIKEAARLSKVGMDAFLGAVEPGMRQADVVAICEHAARMAGADEVSLYMAAGNPWLWGLQRHDLIFQEGDLLALEVNARYKGYYGQVARAMPIGKVSQEKLQIRDAAKAAHDRMISIARPGITPRELFQSGLELVRDRGFDYSGVRFGHGLGMTIGEGFSITAEDTTPIPEGAYMICHPLLIKSSTASCAIYGNQFILRSDGPELLTND